jgi:hypothetical protein
MAKRKDDLAEDILSRHACLKSERATWDTLWQNLADYIMPRKSQVTTRKTEGVEGFTDDIYDMTAIRANMTLAAGQLNYVTPATERWFAFEMPEELKERGGEAGARWFQQCTEIAFRELARSNFYLEIHELYLDRGGFGTSIVYAEEGKRNTLNFQNWEVGTYSVAEDSEGIVDTVFRDFELTCRQAVQRFGIANVGESVQKCFEHAGKNPTNLDRKFEFVHAIFPREDDKRQPGKVDGPNKPIASVYVSVKDKCCVRNSGFDEMPVAVSRFLKWGKSPYGYSPSIEALPTVKQVNFIEKQMDSLAELAAFPRILIPDGLEGDVDLRAGGVTVFDPNNAGGQAVPKEWATQGRYDIGLQRVQAKQTQIEDAYHVTLFKMFAERNKQMTAREVIERVQEKLVQFSPTFARMTTELLNPMLERVFGICFRAGKFPEPPMEVLIPTVDGVSLPLPQVSYTSKIAMAIRALENQAFMQFVEIVAPLVQVDPTVLDAVNTDKAIKGLARNLSLPVEWVRTDDEIAGLRQQRAQAQAAQAQAEQAKLLAGAAKDVSQVDPAMRQEMAAAAGV